MFHDAILLVDAGNSKLKWNYLDRKSGQLSTKTRAYAYQNGKIPSQLAASIDRKGNVSQVLISNVAGKQVKRQLQSVLSDKNCSFTFAEVQSSFAGVQCAYKVVDGLGVDRWMAIIAAAEHHLHEQVLCIVSCGTATTLDFLTPAKQHLGGMIGVGRELIRRYLYQNTADIEKVLGAVGAGIFSIDTESAVNSGAGYSVAGMINMAVADARQELTLDVQVIITGGDADSIIPLLRDTVVQDEKLVMKGLAIVARMSS